MQKFKITQILFFLLLPIILISVPLNESFTGTIFPPLGWRVINNDGGTQTWERYTTNFYTSPACVSSRYEGISLRNDDWLITPRLKCSEVTFDTLKFWYRKSGGGNPESLEIRLSTTGSNINDFTILLWAKKFTNTNYILKTIALDTFDGQEMYIAFVNKGLYGSRINLDDITGPEIKEIRDVAVDSIIYPSSSFVMRPLGRGFQPKARIKNYSNAIQRNIPVICSILGQNSVLRYENIKYLDSLLIDSSKTITFDTFVPIIAELCTIKIRTFLTDDTNSLNNQKIRQTQIIKPNYTGGPDAGYAYWIDSDTTGGPIYNWIDISTTGSPLPTGDVNVSGPIPIGFTFNFYGEPMTYFYYSTNGFISFNELSLSYNTNSPIPFSDAPNNIIAPFWDDLNILNARHKTFDLPPVRYKIIQWRGLVMSSGVNRDTVEFQIILYENGEIIFQYKRCENLYKLGLGQSATIGIENNTGLIGLQYLYNGAPEGNLLSAGRAIRFSRYSHDVSADSVLIPTRIGYGDTILPGVLIKNLGTNTETFCTYLKIEDNKDLVYLDSVEITNMLPATACTVNFQSWIGNQFGLFTATAWAKLDSDYIRSNDSCRKNIEVILPSPTLLFPSNNLSTNNTNLTFDWTDVNNATQYNLKVYEAKNEKQYAENGTIIWNISDLAKSKHIFDTIISVSECGPISFSEGTYFWRVRAGTENYWSNWSDTFKFTIDTTPPPIPILLNPSPNCTLSLECPNFVWRTSLTASEYNLLVIKAEDTLLNILTSDSIYSPSRPLPIGEYLWSVRCRDRANNWSDYAMFWRFYVNYPIWQRKSDIPDSNSLKPVKDGGCLTSDGNKIYALKGNNTQDFYAYDITTNKWQIKSPVPFFIRDSIVIKRKVKAGASLVYADGIIFAIKGNNTKEFWKYEPGNDTWSFCQLAPSIKPFKDGSSLTYYNGNIYCLVGSSRDCEFLKYDISQNSWEQLDSPPKGIHNRIFKSGSCIVYGGNNKIYALKGGAKYNEFYCYDINENSWTEKESLPYLPYGKRYKVRAGGAITYDGQNMLYAIKGNKCQEVWAYNTLSGHWQFQDTIPKLNKRSFPKNGASLIFANNRLFILKGNRTREFWAYIPQNIGKRQNLIIGNENQQIEQNIKQSIKQNVRHKKQIVSKVIYFSNRKMKIRADNAISESTVIRLYDIQGRLLKSIIRQISNSGLDSEISLDNLPKGIYFLVISQ
ncbi:MAG: choice-of-anchor J domain-containing protein [candidate division WOR-3 bacterium]|nr:choice-of-anchor J domain-containing protein [candidate division WOR-3 bacterium]